MLSWLVGIVLIIIGVLMSVVIFFGIAAGDETGKASPLPTLWGLLLILLGAAIIYWR